jgi:subfamily B ATP-binding cassette protein MsbA
MIRLIVDLPRTFVQHFRAFRRYTGNHMFALTALNIVMSWIEGIGLALFYPLLARADDNSKLSSSFGAVLDTFGIPPTPAGVLPIIVGVFIIKSLLGFVTYSYQGWLAARIPLQLRREIIETLRRSDFRTIIGSNTGFVSNLLVNEVNKVDSGFVSFVRAFPPAFNIAVFFTIVVWLDWRMTLACAAMGLCAIAIIGVTGAIAQRASAVLVRENAILSSLLIQMIQAFKYLRSTAGLGTFQTKIGESAERSAHAEFKNNAAAALSQSLAQPVMVLLLSGILYYQAVVQGQPLGSLFVLLLYFFRIMTELWTLQYNWQSFISYIGSIDVVYDTIESYRKVPEANGTRPFTGLTREITLERLSFRYVADREVLKEIDLRIAKNTTVAFVGESGAGKSTIVDLVLGTLKPTSGRIVFDDVPLAEIDLETLRPHVGYVPQDAMLFDDTIANNIAMGKPVDEAQIREAATRAKCDFIDAAPEGLQSMIGDRGVRLSGGQRQRIVIARELVRNPSILVLDEATSALDSESERAIQQSIDALAGQMTILIIAHRLSTIRKCEHVCVLHAGQIVEQGSYDELAAREGSRFRRLIDLQELTQ